MAEPETAARPLREGSTVLIIDDEILSTDPLVRLLLLDGFRITCIQTGTEGIACALTATWDAIVVDLHLADVLGITVLSELRQYGVTAPVLVITGWYMDDGHRSAAAALGAAGFLYKPVAADVLAGVLRSTIGAIRPRSSEHSTPSAKIAQTVEPPVMTGVPPSGRGQDRVLSSLHARATAGDAQALDTICESVIPVLEHSIRGEFRRTQPDWIHDAVQDAIIEFRAHSQRFDRDRGGSLTSFLRLAARRNLLNRVDAERRRVVREGLTVADPATKTPPYERDLDLRHAMMKLWAQLTEVEQRVLRLVLRGERRSPVLAQAANLGHLPLSEQRRAAKRITNRIFQRMRRRQTEYEIK